MHSTGHSPSSSRAWAWVCTSPAACPGSESSPCSPRPGRKEFSLGLGFASLARHRPGDPGSPSGGQESLAWCLLASLAPARGRRGRSESCCHTSFQTPVRAPHSCRTWRSCRAAVPGWYRESLVTNQPEQVSPAPRGLETAGPPDTHPRLMGQKWSHQSPAGSRAMEECHRALGGGGGAVVTKEQGYCHEGGADTSSVPWPLPPPIRQPGRNERAGAPHATHGRRRAGQGKGDETVARRGHPPRPLLAGIGYVLRGGFWVSRQRVLRRPAPHPGSPPLGSPQASSLSRGLPGPRETLTLHSRLWKLVCSRGPGQLGWPGAHPAEQPCPAEGA